MEEKGELICALCVSSIVEGVDQTTDTIRVDWDIFDTDTDKLHKDYYNAIEEVNNQAHLIWMDTHGCETCANHFGVDLDMEYCPVWLDCPDCEGRGEVI